MWSLSRMAALRGFKTTAAMPSPRAYPSTSLSHIRDLPEGESIDSLLSAMYIPVRRCQSRCSYKGRKYKPGVRIKLAPAAIATCDSPLRRV